MMLQKMMKKMRRNNKKGFTLIELIVVIAILAILAAILVPSMVGYLNNAKQSTANANARTVYSAASSAAAACIASGTAPSSISKAASSLSDSDEFEKQLKTMLGSTFSGNIKVTVNNGNVTETKWSEGTIDDANGITGTYTVGGASGGSSGGSGGSSPAPTT